MFSDQPSAAIPELRRRARQRPRPLASRRARHSGARRRWFALLAVLCLTAGAATCADATENGEIEYPIGVNTAVPGFEPPPNQTQFFNYSEYYNSNSFVNGAGKSEIPGFGLNVEADAVRLLHTWNARYGPITFTSGIVQTLERIDVAVDGHSRSTFDRSDLTLQALVANYVAGNHKVFAYGGLDFSFPTGPYAQTNLASTGLNYTTFTPNGAVTWYPSRTFQASLKALAEIHSTNYATNYHSGSSVDFDYSFEYAPMLRHPKLHLGLQGYAFQQFTDDRLKGQVYNAGNRGRAFGIGPQVRLDVPGGGVVFKYQTELAVQNRSVGNRYWVQFAIPIAL